MARNADIRLYLVKQFPYMNLKGLLRVAELTEKEIKNGLTFNDGRELPKLVYVSTTINYMGSFVNHMFNIRTMTKFTNEVGDLEFTIASLSAFVDELKVLVHVRGMGECKFSEVVIPADPDIIYSFSQDEEVYSIFNAELFSCLTRRFQNRGRRGCDNDYHFEIHFPQELLPVNVSIKDIVINETDISYRLFVDTEIMHNALAGTRTFVPPVVDGVKIKKEELKPVITMHKPMLVQGPIVNMEERPALVETMDKDVSAKIVPPVQERQGLLKRFINKFF